MNSESFFFFFFFFYSSLCQAEDQKKKEEKKTSVVSLSGAYFHGVSGRGGSLQDITSGYVSKRDCIILVLTSQLAWKYIVNYYYSYYYYFFKITYNTYR